MVKMYWCAIDPHSAAMQISAPSSTSVERRDRVRVSAVLYERTVSFKHEETMRDARRCWWAKSDPLYHAYHDDEWGRPVMDDRRLYEKLVLEGFQAGLSWLIILRKRPRFRAVFAEFDPELVARFGARDVRRLLADRGIVRHRGKIMAAIENARRVLAVQRELGSFAAYVWGFAPAVAAAPATRARIPSQTAASRALARDLKARGFRFVGPTTVYAFMQAMGLVNDHLRACPARRAVETDRARLRRSHRIASQSRARPLSSRNA
jgi:DNA-3-methyladenine glycosylase I